MKTKQQLTFLDLFAGCGGIRLAFEQAGYKCKASWEIDREARKTLYINFDTTAWLGLCADVFDLTPNDCKADVITVGLPCQPFSRAGVSKNRSLGRPTGMDDPRGRLYEQLLFAVREGRPKAVLIENVPAFESSRAFKDLALELDSEGYFVTTMLIVPVAYVPQRRKRLYVVALKKRYGHFAFYPYTNPCLSRRESIENSFNRKTKLKEILEKNVADKYYLSDKLMACLERHKANGKHNFGYSIADPEGQTRTLSARYGKDGSEILIRDRTDRNPRRLTPRECARLMGFPDTFILVGSETQQYRQLGNSVVVPLVQHLAIAIGRAIGG